MPRALAKEALAGSHTKVRRAEARLVELREELTAYFSSRPFALEKVVVESSSHPHHVKFKITKEPSSELAAIVGETAQALRSALDLAVSTMLDMHPNPNVVQFKIAYPLAAGRTDVENEMKRTNVSAIHPELTKIIRESRPFSDGNPYLYPIHQIARKDRHVRLGLMGASISQPPTGSWRCGPGNEMRFVPIAVGQWLPIPNGASLAWATKPNFSVDVDFPVALSMTEPDVWWDKPVDQALERGIGEVKRVLEQIERRGG